jgi:MFS family permease
MQSEKTLAQASSWTSIVRDPVLSRIVLFQVFNGLSSGIYTILIMLYIQYLDSGLGDLYLAHFAIYYLVGSLANSVLLIPAGLFADRFGRKPALVIGAFLLAINGFIPPFASQWWQLLPASLINAAGSALYTPAQAALVADVSFGYRREKSYSVVYFTTVGFTTVGLVVFSLYAFIFQAMTATAAYYQLMLIMSAALGLVGVVPIALLRKVEAVVEKGRMESIAPPKDVSKQRRFLDVPTELGRNGVVIKLLAINFLIGLGAGFIIPIFTYYWKAVFSLSDSSVTAISMLGYVGLAAGTMLTPWLAGRAKALGGRVGTIVIFQGVSIVCAAYLAIAPLQMSLYPAIVAYVARTVLMNAINPLTSALLMDHSPTEKRGLYNSLISIAFNVPNSISPLFTFFIYASVQPPYGFTYPISILVFLYTISDIIYVTIRKADKSLLSAQERGKLVQY